MKKKRNVIFFIFTVFLTFSLGMKLIDNFTLKNLNEIKETELSNHIIEIDSIYDLVILNGKIIDPESENEYDGWNIGINKDTIAIITQKELKGKKELNAKNLIVSSGFIDLLTYDPVEIGAKAKIADGVTSNICMHGGAAKTENWYSHWKKMKPLVNYGASFAVNQARMILGIDIYEQAKGEKLKKLLEMAEKALLEGALGVSFSLEYSPGCKDEEIYELMLLAKKYDAPTFFHVRYSDMEPPGTNIEALEEVINFARRTKAAVHIDHIHSTGGTFSMKESLQMIKNALAEGLDFTACVYPYDYWGTHLNTTRFSDSWQKRFRIDYKDLQVAGTNERLTKETFEKYRKQGKLVVAYAIPEEELIMALQTDFVMIGSDAILTESLNNHPRACGTYARTIGLYSREKKVIDLKTALKKCSYLPAKRMEKIAPIFKKLGRIKVGAYADLTIFDFDKIIDRATPEKTHLYSEGIHYTIISGQIVKEKDSIFDKVRVGKEIRSKHYSKR